MNPASPRSLDQILTQLSGVYDPQIQSIQQQQAGLPAFQEAQLSGLAATKDNAFSDILGGARQRGIGFSGIPLAEQAKYTASTYLPSVSQTQQQFSDQNFNLANAIASLNQDRYKTANTLYQNEQSSYQDYLAKQAATAASNTGFSFGGGTTTPAVSTTAPKITKKSDGGYSFTDASGRPISAAVYYAQVNGSGTGFNNFLRELGKAGDQGAASAANFVGDDFRYDPTKLNSAQLAQLYNSLVWGAPNVAQANAGSYNFDPNKMGGLSTGTSTAPTWSNAAQTVKNNNPLLNWLN